LRSISKYSFLIILGIVSWAVVLVLNGFQDLTTIGLPDWATSLAYASFVGFNFLMLSQIIGGIEKWDVIELLWKLLVIGVVGIVICFMATLLKTWIDSGSNESIKKFIDPVEATIKLYAVLVFFLSSLFVFQKLIFYQKNKRKVFLWRAFLILLTLTVIIMFFPEMMRSPGWVAFFRTSKRALASGLVVCCILLAANVNWTAYLTIKQKLRSLFVLGVILILFVAYGATFPFAALEGAEGYGQIVVSKYMFFGFIFIFPASYSIFSALVLIFNLPTTSVFEQRSSELASFQRIHQSIQSSKLDYGQILNTLLDSSILTSNSSTGWIKVIDEGIIEKGFELVHHKNINPEEITDLKQGNQVAEKVIRDRKYYHVKNLKKHRAFKGTSSKYRSMLVIPILSRDKAIGALFLVQELSNTYEDENIRSLVTFAEQAAIAVENAELLESSIDIERYKKEVEIAREVQVQILPSEMPSNGRIEFFAVAQDADEIGGDYYDFYRFNDHFYKVALGDISGSGTQAAFYMAETKGIFQALAPLEMSVKEFMVNANKALGNCLAKGKFMTLTYLHIDLEKNEVELLRAGHCPTLYYDSVQDKMEYIEKPDMPGLGIIRNPGFNKFVPETTRLNPSSGDMIILFTDGIVEAKNEEREEFDYPRMLQLATQFRKFSPKEVSEKLLQEVETFTGGKIDDDYTILTIKFL
jgi:sigma-B regulation protein RsbU (phosphoserine phosphatase)